MSILAFLSTQVIDTTTVGRSVMTAVDAAAARTAIGAQPLDADLTALAALSGTNDIYYRSAANTWTSVTIGTGLTFTGGTLAASGGSGISSLNGLTDATQTFAVGTTGTNFGIVSVAGVHTFNLPDASATARGVVSTGAQTIAGAKTFSSSINLSSGGAIGIGFRNNNTEWFSSVNNQLLFRLGGSARAMIDGSYNTDQGFSTGFLWYSGSTFWGLLSDGAQTIAQRASTNAQTYRIYNTYTSATSFERLNIGWATNVCTIGTEAGSGGGTLRGLRIGSASTSLIGLWGATPVTQPATVAAPTGGTVIDAEARTAIQNIINRLQASGLIA